MAININSRRSGTVNESKAATFNEAIAGNSFDLARLWADRLSWPMNGTANDELAELACMSALARRLSQ